MALAKRQKIQLVSQADSLPKDQDCLQSNAPAKDEPTVLAESEAAISDNDWLTLQHEVSRYIASMTAEMANMARSAKLDLLVYFLDMAKVEATAQAENTDR